MNPISKKVIKLALEGLRKLRKEFIFDANLARYLGADGPKQVTALERVKEIDAAIVELVNYGS